MKYTNKHTDRFKKTWYKIYTNPLYYGMDSVKRWAYTNGSNGRFFFKRSAMTANWTIYEVYFENEQDATLFALKWL